MSKWPMRGHFRYLRFKTFPMTPRTPQCKVFWPLLSNSEHSGVPEDFKSPTLEVLGFTPHLAKVGLRPWEFDSRPLKIRNHPDFLACRWHAIYWWKALEEYYNFTLELTLIGVLYKKVCTSKVAGVPISRISRLPLGSLETK